MVCDGVPRCDCGSRAVGPDPEDPTHCVPCNRDQAARDVLRAREVALYDRLALADHLETQPRDLWSASWAWTRYLERVHVDGRWIGLPYPLHRATRTMLVRSDMVLANRSFPGDPLHVVSCHRDQRPLRALIRKAERELPARMGGSA